MRIPFASAVWLAAGCLQAATLGPWTKPEVLSHSFSLADERIHFSILLDGQYDLVTTDAVGRTANAIGIWIDVDRAWNPEVAWGTGDQRQNSDDFRRTDSFVYGDIRIINTGSPTTLEVDPTLAPGLPPAERGVTSGESFEVPYTYADDLFEFELPVSVLEGWTDFGYVIETFADYGSSLPFGIWGGQYHATLVRDNGADGDMNLDLHFDHEDIRALVLGLLYPAQYESMYGLAPALHGDMNGDGRLDFDDIEPFVALMIGPDEYQATYGSAAAQQGDMNGNGTLDFDDLEEFVGTLQGGAVRGARISAVSEPATATLAAWGTMGTAVWGWARRRRKRLPVRGS